jgi:hypothetical protein
MPGLRSTIHTPRIVPALEGDVLSDRERSLKMQMPDSSALDDVPCDLSLNGLPLHSVRVRQTGDCADDFDVIVTDPVLGAFSLHAGFDIDVRERDSSWRRVSLDELKGILKSRNLLPIEDLPRASEMAECRLFARVDDIEIPHWESAPRSVLRRQDACVHYVQRILYRVGIPHLVAGTTFIVPSAGTVRIPLKRAGFRKSEISPSAWVEPRTGCSIQLIERHPNE